MAIQIGATPDSGFDDPVGMLKDCHRRIEQFLRILCLVVERAHGRALTDEEAAAIDSALHYFGEGGARHTADEEESLFPRMRENQSTADVLREIEALESDHLEACDLHLAVEKLYRAWAEGRRQLSGDEEERLRDATQRLQRLYEGHIRIEEELVFPRAKEALDHATIAAIGEEFRARRA